MRVTIMARFIAHFHVMNSIEGDVLHCTSIYAEDLSEALYAFKREYPRHELIKMSLAVKEKVAA